ncbi:MAG: S9 family peptidase [Gemmatimonadetes bacterium]|nr:S9 family peptidase [Gemmatimonadota bacterium]MBI3568245.1 S9 family peptidase [Gemmatimonadota bacterium]
MPDSTTPLPPVAPRVPHVTVLHGETRTDDFAWMRDRTDPRVMAYLEAENAYTTEMTRHTEALQETLYQEMVARLKEDDSRPPERRGEWFYYSRTEQGKAYPIYCRRHGSVDAPEEVYYDQNEAAAGLEFHSLGGLEVSPDHRYLAILEDINGYEDFTLRVRDLASGAWLPDRKEKLGFGLAWASDGRTLFYLTTDAAKRSDRVWRHRLGDPSEADVAVFHDPDARFNVGVSRTRSGAFVCCHSGSFTSTEVWVLDAFAPEGPLRCVAPRTADVEYDVAHGGDWFYITTNRDGARNFKVMRAPVADPAAWGEWMPHRADAFVEGIDVFEAWAVVQERREGLRRLRLVALASEASHDVSFPEPAYGVDLTRNPEFATNTLRFVYSSLVTPPSVFDYDVVTRERVLVKRDEVLGGYDPSRYAVERLMVTARDGVQVPVSLVYRTPFERDGRRPLLLYAYGSYGYTLEPTFGSPRFSLVDRGMVYAIAHVRGGQEMGRAWYDDGKMAKKMNSFTDFIDCAEHLVRAGYTSTDRLAANGGSAGGLLMGAVLNLRPDLFKAVVADVPFVDVINTMLDDTIPLTAQEWEQWGNPHEADAYAVMRRYSPYDNLEAKAYPALLVTSGINDSRVAFWEPAKWVAKLRTLKTDSHPLLLKMHLGAGHGGASGRYERLREQAFRYAFILDQTVPATPS